MDHSGKLQQITFSEHSRATKYEMSVKEAQEFYEAFLEFAKLIKDPKNVIEIKFKAGDMFALNNRRVLHGRTAFEMKRNEVRWAEGGYVDWDALNSRRRLLMNTSYSR